MQIASNLVVDGPWVVRHQQIRPAVVVVIEEPGRKAEERFAHAGLCGDLGKRAIAVVAIEKVCAVEVGDKKVNEAIVVIIGRRSGFAECGTIDAGFMRDVFKCSISAIAKKL